MSISCEWCDCIKESSNYYKASSQIKGYNREEVLKAATIHFTEAMEFESYRLKLYSQGSDTAISLGETLSRHTLLTFKYYQFFQAVLI